jgi:endogenous inhibitor of DNA gyrase (YacG/DUF329 family)
MKCRLCGCYTTMTARTSEDTEPFPCCARCRKTTLNKKGERKYMVSMVFKDIPTEKGGDINGSQDQVDAGADG